MSHGASLTATRRDTELRELADGAAVDVLVVGGGVTGAGAALDAASRGLSVALVEREDLAFGTSRWSSKLVHGGLRYLAQGDFGIAHESARERAILLGRTAPHLVRPVPVMLPLHKSTDAAAERRLRIGFGIGDVLRRVAGTTAESLPRSRRVPAAEAAVLAPGIRRDGLRGALLAWDAQLEDDARLVVALARTAAAHGARILTRVEAHAGGHLTDRLTGERLTVRPRITINATGVWAPELETGLRLRPSRGSHLVLAPEALGGLRTTLNVAVPGESGRYVFAIPQPDGAVYVGLTDEPVDAVEDVPVAPESDVDFLLSTMSLALERPLGRDDVLGTYAGLRPLIEGAAGARSADLSRRHAILSTTPGVVTVVGGKLTTYRRMAEDAVDRAIEVAGLAAGPSRTRSLPLVGAAAPGELAHVDAPLRLVQRYGTEAPAVHAMAPHDELEAQLRWGAAHELALTPGDLLDRRTRVGLVASRRAEAEPLAERVLGLGVTLSA